MRIYRVEALDTGLGPYASNAGGLTDLLDKYGCYRDDRCPVPENDGIFAAWGDASAHKHMHYAFNSLDQLFDWFDIDCVLDLFDLGFVIAEYEVNAGHVRMGGHHLAYNAGKAACKALYDTVDFLAEHKIW